MSFHRLDFKCRSLMPKPRYFNGSPSYQAESVEAFESKLSQIGLSFDW